MGLDLGDNSIIVFSPTAQISGGISVAKNCWSLPSRIVGIALTAIAIVLLLTSYASAAEFLNTQVSPTWGEQGTKFNFSATYTGTSPGYVRVYIDRQPFEMSRTDRKDDGYYVYEYVWTSSANAIGNYTHYYEAQENGQISRSPSPDKGNYYGPQIIEEFPQDNLMYLFDVSKGALVWEHDNASTWVDDVCISNTAGVIAFRDSQGLIKVFSSKQSVPIWSRMTISGKGCIDIDDNGKLMAVTSGGTLYLFEGASRKLKWNHSADAGEYQNVAISRDGRFIAAAGDNGGVDYFDVKSSKPISSFKLSKGIAVESLALSGSGEYIAIGTGYPDCRVMLYKSDLDDPVGVWALGRDGAVLGVDISVDGRHVVSVSDEPLGSKSPSLYLFKRGVPEPVLTFNAKGSHRAVAASDDMKIFAAGDGGGELTCFADQQPRPAWKVQLGGPIASVAVSRDGKYVVAGSMDRTVSCFSAATGNLLWSYKTANYINSVAFSPEGQFLVAANGADRYLGVGIHTGDTDNPKVEKTVSKDGNMKEKSSIPPLGWDEKALIAGIFLIFIGLAWFTTKRFVKQ